MFNVVVVGGGPSGATAAEDLARAGARLALLDKAGRIKPCGGAIPPRLIEDFTIPDDQIVARISTARMVSPTGRSVDIPIENRFVGMVDRGPFDEYLRGRAAAQGVDRRSGQCLQIERGDSTAVSTGTRPRARKPVCRRGSSSARTGLGRGSRRRRCREERTSPMSSPTTSPMSSCHRLPRDHRRPVEGRAGLTGRRGPPPGVRPAPLRRDLRRGGQPRLLWLGVCARAPRKRRHGHGDGGSRPEGGHEIPPRAAGLAECETIRRQGTPIPLKPLDRWDNGRDVVLAGDAAGMVAPSSGDGIYYAMVGGRVAATAALAALRTGRAAELRIARKLFMREHKTVFRLLRTMQDAYYRPDERRERFVSLCHDVDVQRLTFEAYMNSRPT